MADNQVTERIDTLIELIKYNTRVLERIAVKQGAIKEDEE